MFSGNNHKETSKLVKETAFGRRLENVRRSQTRPYSNYYVNRTLLDRVKEVVASIEGYRSTGPGVLSSTDIEMLASEDQLTGLSSPQSFVRGLEFELKRGMYYKRPVALCLLSIDQLEELRIHRGDLACAAVLKSVADVLIGSIRAVDIRGRYSALELAAAFPETDVTGCMVVAERIRQQVHNNMICSQSQDIHVSVSIGVAAFPTHGHEKDELIAKASQALDVAVFEGGNCIRSL